MYPYYGIIVAVFDVTIDTVIFGRLNVIIK